MADRLHFNWQRPRILMRKQPPAKQSLPAIPCRKELAPAPSPGGNALALADEAGFGRQIYLERRRAERNRRSLLLVLMAGMEIADPAARAAMFRALIGNLQACCATPTRWAGTARAQSWAFCFPTWSGPTRPCLTRYSTSSPVFWRIRWALSLRAECSSRFMSFPLPWDWRANRPT